MTTTDGDYDAVIDAIVHLLRTDIDLARAKFPSADKLAERLRVDHPSNGRLFDALEVFQKTLRITPAKLQAALGRKRAAEARERANLETAEHVVAELGAMPGTEREYVKLLAEKRGYRALWDRTFFDATNQRVKWEEIVCDAHLSAADLGLVKPRGDLLGVGLIDKALEEWAHLVRHERFGLVWDSIKEPTDERKPARVLADFAQVCQWYFQDAEYAEAAIRKVVWSVKRRMCGRTIVHMQMIVLLGQQATGKGAFCDLLCAPVAEITADTSLSDVLDSRQMDLPAYYLLKLDEMAYADRADVAALKTFITSNGRSGRPMKTNIAVKNPTNATLLGTTNKTLGVLILDSTGMRRFIELKVRRRAEIEPHWQDIVAFDWHGLWQVVDPSEDDPLMSRFADRVKSQIEELRTPENVEAWLGDFETPGQDYRVKARTPDHVEWYANDLFNVFREWEETYNPRRVGTNLSRWGRDMKWLIANGGVGDGWETYRLGNKTVYRMQLSAVGSRANQPESRVVALRPTEAA